MKPKRRLERDKSKAVVAGVLAGLAEYFNQDPVLLRVAAIVLLILTGLFPGAIFYIIAWLMMPEKKTDPAARQHFDYEASNE